MGGTSGSRWLRGCGAGMARSTAIRPSSRTSTRSASCTAGVQDRVATQVVRSPRTAVAALTTLARATRADELLVTMITTDPADRVRSTELLAQAWAEKGAAA